MRRYEMMLLITDTIDEDAAKAVFERAKELVAKHGGTMIDEAWWGKRKLAYEIDHRDHGFYGILDFEATTEAVSEVERLMKITDEVVRLKTVRPEIRVRSA
ncbi:MAG: 30S ribosomal protein S6 [Nitriliruptoraceae bacterium]